MIVSYVNNRNLSNLRPVNATAGKTGHWVMVWPKNKANAAVQVQRKLAVSVPRQWVGSTRDQLAYMGGCLQIHQPTAQFARTYCPQHPNSATLLFAKHTEVIIGNVDFQSDVTVLFT